ncbi:hypothetical protein [Herbaspirillum sp. alder98]|uniref:rolling circle replication-associated protein n=1 Tax=Herbaspirillum sp. alder98 TaxID=2913096 RepID=UPI001CD862C0|nr:hypothetical protein [Herbaspirillum sp. alder98]MCA1323761.1 hypothetical protein [Herbaspirillum sp. alder98]
MSESYIVNDDMSNIMFDDVRPEQLKPDWWDDDGIKNTWNDRYVARKVVFPDGQMEITVAKEKHFIGPAITPKSRKPRGESENRERNDQTAGRAAKKRVRQACKTIGADRMITLTYRQNVTDRERALKDWDKFRRRVGKHNQFLYVAVIEVQERGAIHFHVAVRGRQCYHLLRSIWSGIVGKDEAGRSMSNIDVRNPSKFGFGKEGVHKLAAYIAKYCSKEMSSRTLEQKRYFCSRGIPKPDVISWPLVCNKSIDAVRTAFLIAEAGGLSGAQYWYNKGLDVIWIATPPCAAQFETAPF